MSKTPTAEEFLDLQHKTIPDIKFDIRQVMIEFAKLHVKAALEAAAEKAVVEIVDHEYGFRQLPEPIYGVNSESIEEAYPLTNIK